MQNQNKIKEAFTKVKSDILNLQSQILLISNNLKELKRTFQQTDTSDRQTDQQIIPTLPYEIKGLKPQNSYVSIGNDGVPTDRQTDQQTDQQTDNNKKNDQIEQIRKASEIVTSLDTLKQDLRLKFKRLTNQEMLIFTTLYQLTDKGFIVDYSLLAEKTSLTESSIRDYILKLTKKGAPIIKTKENNKKITLSIPHDFKKVASLSSLISLRNL